MALLSQLAMEKINRNETYSYDWNRYCNLFEISGQKQLRDKSHMDELGQAVINLITKEKGDIAAAAAAGIVLIVMILVLNLLAKFISKKFNKAN